MEQSEQITELAAALSKAQGEVEGAKKDAENPAFKRDGKAMKYADLGSVWDACRDALGKNGLSIIQAPGLTCDGVMHMTTMLAHSSGQWVRQEMSLPLAKVDAQGAGSALTYMRRYALAAFVGIAPEDDDGNAALRPAQGAVDNNREPARQAPPPLKGPIKTRAALKTACATFVRELEASDDSDTLESFLAMDESKALVAQVQDEHEFFWLGDGNDFLGMEKEIAKARTRVGEQGFVA